MTPHRNAPGSRTRILLAFGAVYILWGSTFLAIKFAITTIPPLLMGGTRFLLAGALLYGFARFRGAARPNRGEFATAAISGTLMIAVGNGGVVWAQQSIPSGVASLVVATVPLWMVLIELVRPAGNRPRALDLVSVALGLTGMVILIGPSALLGRGPIDPAGAVIVLIGSIGWAAGSVITSHSARPRSALAFIGIQMLAGSVAFLAAAFARGEHRMFALDAITRTSATAWLYLVVAGSLIGFTAYIYLLKHVSAAQATTYAYVNPIVAVLLGWAFAGEPITAQTAGAAAVTLAGVAMATMAPPRNTPHTGEYPVPVESTPE